MTALASRMSRVSSARDRLAPTRERSGPSAPPRPLARWQLAQDEENSRSPLATLPAAGSLGVTLSVWRYATSARISASGALLAGRQRRQWRAAVLLVLRELPSRQ